MSKTKEKNETAEDVKFITFAETAEQLEVLQAKLSENENGPKFLFMVVGNGANEIYAKANLRDLSMVARGFADHFLEHPQNREITARGVEIALAQADNFRRIMEDPVGRANWERMVSEDRKAIEAMQAAEVERKANDKREKEE